MSTFTFESHSSETKYETYEWDNTWLDHVTDSTAKRVLYIGDSISCGVRTAATELSGNKIYFDGFGSSKSLDNPWFKESIKIFAQQQGYRNAILFNNGLHGWHLNDETEYRSLTEDMIVFLTNNFPKTPVFMVLTTYIRDNKLIDRVITRNKVACDVAKKYNLPIIDFYSISKNNAHLLKDDGVHFIDEGSKILAQEILSSLNI